MELTFSKCGHHMAMGQLECGQCALDESRKADDVAQACDRGDCVHHDCRAKALAWDIEALCAEVEKLTETSAVKNAVWHLRSAADYLGKG